MRTLDLSGLTLQPVEATTAGAKFEVTLELTESADGLSGRFEYNADLFEAATIARMAGHLQTMLGSAVTHPDSPLSTPTLLTASGRRHVLVQSSTTHLQHPQCRRLHQP